MLELIKTLLSFAEELDEANLHKQADSVERIVVALWSPEDLEETEEYQEHYDEGTDVMQDELGSGDMPTKIYSPEEQEARHENLKREMEEAVRVKSGPIIEMMSDYLVKVYTRAVRDAGFIADREQDEQSVDITMKEVNAIADRFSTVDSELNVHDSFDSILTAGEYGKDPIHPVQIFNAIESKLLADMNEKGQYYSKPVAMSIAEWALTPLQLYVDKWYSKEDPSITTGHIERAMPSLATRLSGMPIKMEE